MLQKTITIKSHHDAGSLIFIIYYITFIIIYVHYCTLKIQMHQCHIILIQAKLLPADIVLLLQAQLFPLLNNADTYWTKWKAAHQNIIQN